MVSVTEAKRLIDENMRLLPAVSLPIGDTAGLVLAETLMSGIDMPPFDQSAMDGYALHFEAGAGNSAFRVIGEIPAGAPPSLKPSTGEAVRIFTGAPMPEGADTVVVQEKVTRNGNEIRIDDPQLKKGSNVRPRGSQTRQGETALDAGTRLTPGAVGFLAGLGFSSLKVFPNPRVCLIVTGKELAPPGTELKAGQVYESNSFALTAALQELGIRPEPVFKADDDEAAITSCLNTGLEQCDLVILTGGISVGDHDLVKPAMENLGVETIFYKVKQKPGKPLFFGKKGEKRVFALPGNPASVLTCFYEYVVPAILKMTGNTASARPALTLPLSEGFVKKAGLTYFLKGRLQAGAVLPLDAQESYRMNSFAAADCLIVLEEDRTEYHNGEVVEVHPL